MFTDDVVAEYPGREAVDGLPGAVEFMRESHAGVARPSTGSSTSTLTVDGDTATLHRGQAQRPAPGRRDGGPTVVTGRYIDELVRTPDGLAHPAATVDSRLTPPG